MMGGRRRVLSNFFLGMGHDSSQRPIDYLTQCSALATDRLIPFNFISDVDIGVTAHLPAPWPSNPYLIYQQTVFFPKIIEFGVTAHLPLGVRHRTGEDLRGSITPDRLPGN